MFVLVCDAGNGTALFHCVMESRMATAQDTVLTTEEMVAYLKLSKSTLYHLARVGKAPGQKVEERWRFHREAVDNWLENRPRER